GFVFHGVKLGHCAVVGFAFLVARIRQVGQSENNDDGPDCKLKLFAFHAFTPSKDRRHYNINTRVMPEALTPFATILANMKRYPMFAPPEYITWEPHPSILKEFEDTIQQDQQRLDIVSRLDHGQLLSMYAGLLRFRLHDITLRRWVRQGILAKAWLGTGEEA